MLSMDTMNRTKKGEHMTIKYRKLGIFFAGLLMVVGLVTLFNKFNVYQSHLDEVNRKKLDQAATFIELYLKDASDSLKDFSQDEKVINYFKEVTDKRQKKTHKNYEYVQESIKKIVKDKESIYGVVTSSHHVDLLLSEPDLNYKDYTASEHQWFNAPIESTQTFVGYIFISYGNKHSIEMSKTIKDTSVHGVVAIHVSIEPIFDYLIALGDIVIVKDDDAFDFNNIDNLSHLWKNAYALFDEDSGRGGLPIYFEKGHIRNSITQVKYMNKTHNIWSKIEPLTGYQLIVLEDATLGKKMMVSSLLQTFFVFFVLSIVSIVFGIRQDRKIRNNLYKKEV